jgi:hypothetical protein
MNEAHSRERVMVRRGEAPRLRAVGPSLEEGKEEQKETKMKRQTGVAALLRGSPPALRRSIRGKRHERGKKEKTSRVER